MWWLAPLAQLMPLTPAPVICPATAD
jgi:hypothetical protein